MLGAPRTTCSVKPVGHGSRPALKIARLQPGGTVEAHTEPVAVDPSDAPPESPAPGWGPPPDVVVASCPATDASPAVLDPPEDDPLAPDDGGPLDDGEPPDDSEPLDDEEPPDDSEPLDDEEPPDDAAPPDDMDPPDEGAGAPLDAAPEPEPDGEPPSSPAATDGPEPVGPGLLCPGSVPTRSSQPVRAHKAKPKEIRRPVRVVRIGAVSLTRVSMVTASPPTKRPSTLASIANSWGFTHNASRSQFCRVSRRSEPARKRALLPILLTCRSRYVRPPMTRRTCAGNTARRTRMGTRRGRHPSFHGAVFCG